MSAVAHCAVVRNPFSTAVTHAKLPDGAVSMSSSCRYSMSYDISDQSGYVDILLLPGFNAPIVTRQAAGNASTTAPMYDLRTVSTRGYKVASRGTKIELSDNDELATITHSNSVPNQYRVVSQGLRVSMINNSQDNDGWFEAIRINPSYSTTDFGIADAGDPEVGKIYPIPSVFENGIAGIDGVAGTSSDNGRVDLSMNPSYIAGKLRDIHKHTFFLHRNENNDFIEIPIKSTLPVEKVDAAGTGATNGNNAYTQITASQTTDCWWLDNHMDAILIRCRAQPATTGGSAPGLRLHMHLVQHVEECYDEGSDIFRFQTICPQNKRLLDATLAAMKRDIKPSVIRSPTLPVSSTSYSSYKRKSRY